MTLTPEMVAQEMSVAPEYEEIADLDANYALLRRTIRESLEAEDAGADPEAVDDTIGNAIAEAAIEQLEIFDLEVEDYDDAFESAAAAFGEALAEIVEANFEDADQGVAELAATAGMTAEELAGCIGGLLVPTPESQQMIAEAFLEGDEIDDFLELGAAAYEESMADADYPNVVEEDTAQMSAQESGFMAEFNAMREQQQIGTLMRHLEKWADRLHAENILTPFERNSLIRSEAFREDPDSVAVFSQFCQANGTEPLEYLAHVEFCLNWKEQCGASNLGAFFNQMVEEPIDATNNETAYAQEYRSRHGYT